MPDVRLNNYTIILTNCTETRVQNSAFYTKFILLLNLYQSICQNIPIPGRIHYISARILRAAKKLLLQKTDPSSVKAVQLFLNIK